MIYYVIILIAILLTLILLGNSGGKKIRYVYAGKPEGEEYAPISQSDIENTDFISDNKESMDISSYKVFIVKGTSLEPEEISNGSTIFVQMIYWWQRKLAYSKCIEELKYKRFIILQNDAKRGKKENPQRKILNGLKIRRVVEVVDNSLSKEHLMDILKEKESMPVDLLEHVYSKYIFACNYYKNEKLILSVTYKDGIKGYSFHSINYLRGIVKYKTTEMISTGN